MTDVEELLREAMREQTRHLTLPPGAATRALHADRRRRRIGRAGMGVVVAAVAVGLVAITQLPQPDRVAVTRPGGTTEVTLSAGSAATRQQLTSTADLVRARLAAQGITAHTTVVGSALTVSVPVPDRAVVDAAVRPGVLTFREIHTASRGTPQAGRAAGASSAGSTAPTTVTGLTPPAGERDQTTPSAATLAQYAALDCTGSGGRPAAVDEDRHHFVVACDRTRQTKYLLTPADLIGTQVSSAVATQGQTSVGGPAPSWEVDLTFESSAVPLVETVSARLFHHDAQPLAITLDGVVLSASDTEGVLGQNIAILGGDPPFAQRAATQLAADIGTGALPTALTVVSPAPSDRSLGR